MTAPPSATQKPADASPYATLRPSPGPDAPDTQRSPAGTATPPGFTAELAKLQELRDALWDAFKAGPDAGLPTILIELTNCYTNSLRVQLNLKALNTRRPPAAPHAGQQAAGIKK